MATQTPEDSTSKHVATQAAIALLVANATRSAFRSLLNLGDVAGSKRRLEVVVEALAKHYGQAAVAAAMNHYRLERAGANVGGSFKPPPPKPVPQATVDSVVEQALRPLEARAPTPGAVQAAEDDLAAEMEQLVLEQSRSAIQAAAISDHAARGWALVPEPDACSFCALLATRGSVYSPHSFDAANKKFTGPGDAKVHDSCRCHLTPVFNSYEPSAQIRQWQADYRRISQEFGPGRSGLIAWRQHIEGRPVTGPVERPRVVATT